MEAIAVVFDIRCSNNDTNDDFKSYFEKARNCIFKILLRKIFSESKDLITVILVGSDNTVNDLADGSQFKNIEVLSDFIISNWDLVEAVLNIQPTNKDVNWLDGLVVGIQCLRDKVNDLMTLTKVKKNLTQKKLVLLSSFIDDVSEEQVDVVMDNLEELDIELVVIGPDVLSIDGDESSTNFITDKVTKSQQLILKMCKEVTDKGRGSICSCENALKQLKFFSNKKKSRAAWNVNMSLSPDFAIPITGYKLLADEQQPLKWISRSSSNTTVRNDQSFFVGEKEVDREDIVSGYLFGSTVVPFSVNDEEASKYKSGERGISILFVVSSDEVPHYYFMGTSLVYIVGRKNDEEAQKAVSTLAYALSESNTVAIVRRVYSADGNVFIGALYPKIDDSSSGLLFVQLPFRNEIKKLWLPSFSNVSVNDEQINAVDKLIDAMNLSNLSEEDEELYDPENLYDPYEQYLFHCVAARGLNNEKNFTNCDFNKVLDVPEFIQNLILPLPKIRDKSAECLEEIKLLFPLDIIEVKKSVKSENEKSILIEPEDIKVEEEFDSGNVSDFLLNSIRVVGSVDPENDFKMLISKGEEFTKVCGQLQNIIIELVRRSDDTYMLQKPLSCLTLLRKTCIDKNQPDTYNDWLKKFKATIVSIKRQDFWNEVIKGNLGLISIVEENSSNISSDMANEFLKFEVDKSVVIKNEEKDIDDLLDDI